MRKVIAVKMKSLHIGGNKERSQLGKFKLEWPKNRSMIRLLNKHIGTFIT